MPRLIPCPHCHAHVMTPERTCPHCGGSMPSGPSLRAPAVLMSLTLAGCPVGEPEYGVADVSSGSTSMSQATDGDTDAQTGSGSGSGSESGGSDSGSGSSSSTGMADTGTTSVGEPDYGVPETTSG